MVVRLCAAAMIAAGLAACSGQPAAPATPVATYAPLRALPATVLRDTSIYTLPSALAETARSLPAGTSIDIYGRHDQWVQVAARPGTEGIEWIRMLDVSMPISDLADLPDFVVQSMEVIQIDEQIERGTTAITFTGVLKNTGGEPAYQLRAYVNGIDMAKVRALGEQDPGAKVLIPYLGSDVALPDLAPGASVPYQVVQQNPQPDWDYSVGHTSSSAPAAPATATPPR